MHLKDALIEARSRFSNRMSEDSLLYKNLTEKLFGTCVWDQERILRLEASVCSAEKTSRIPGQGKSSQFRDKGYKTKDCLISIFRCLLEAYTKSRHNKLPGVNEKVILKEIIVLYDLINAIIHREEKSETHIEWLKKRLERVKNGPEDMIFCYHSGYPGHAVYINYFNRKGQLYATICNLGRGNRLYQTEHHTNTDLIYPRVLLIKDIDAHVNAVYEAKTKSGKLSNNIKMELLKEIYRTGKHIGYDDEFYEIKQTASNCVVKNYLMSLKGRVKTRDEYLHVLALIRSILCAHIGGFHKDTGLKRDVTNLNKSLIKSQVSFEGSKPRDLLYGLSLYQSGSLVVTRKVEPSIFNPIIARASFSMAGAAVGRVVANELTNRKDLTATEKTGIKLFSTLLGGCMGEGFGNFISQPKISEKQEIGEDVAISAKKIMHCDR